MALGTSQSMSCANGTRQNARHYYSMEMAFSEPSPSPELLQEEAPTRWRWNMPQLQGVQNQHIVPWVWGGGSGQWWDHKGAPRQKGSKHPTLSWVSWEKILVLPVQPLSDSGQVGEHFSHTELLLQTHRWCQCHRLYPCPQHHLPPVCHPW